ncbi:MAG: orotidine-5'-phosphate decarboxylase [Candidatus Magasanikbacteria bacterium]|nr:orotidine-5'-phosphate decarboxylase [Candidatus Magasanikbacteria bacterium]
MKYSEKIKILKNPIAKKLLKIVESKQTNLCLAADVHTSVELLNLAETIGPHIAVLKTHLEITEDWTPGLGEKLKAIAQKHNFLIFEDRKLADIGNTMIMQYENSVFEISKWADLINVHPVVGLPSIKALAERTSTNNCGLLLLAELSVADNLTDETYKQKSAAMATELSEYVTGFIARGAFPGSENFLVMAPGVKLEAGTDNKGQQYLTPEIAIKGGSDLIIVGRGIIQAADPLAMAIEYKKAGWQAHLKQM